MKRILLSTLIIAMFSLGSTLFAQDTTYVGEATCLSCHSGMHADLVTNYQNSGHPYKLNAVDGAPPVYPDGTTKGVANPPSGSTWDDFAYVIGGYGWKSRFVKKDGRIFTVNDSAQYNLWAENDDEEWVAYHLGEDKKYDSGCFPCHTTGPTAEGSWVPDSTGYGDFSEPGVRCEGCHGPGSAHAGNPSTIKLPRKGDDLTITRCGECHQRGGATNAIPASGSYIKHHEQVNEMSASKHFDGNGTDLTCGSCHDAHVPLVYPDAAVAGTIAIIKKCQDCHSYKQILVNGAPKSIDCIDCHMPMASKSALGHQRGNGWQGDVKTHIMAINTAPVVRDSTDLGMFTNDGAAVRLDENGLAAVTMDFACLSCHQDKDVAWAATYAQGIHTNHIQTLPDYIGDATCKGCHSSSHATLVANYEKSGHPYKLNPVTPSGPVYPDNTSPGVPNTPDGTTWDDFSYVIGGYGWKARFVKKDGNVFTANDSAQYNLWYKTEDEKFVAYHLGETKPYNYGCFQCHTTGPNADADSSWADGSTGLGYFEQPGVRCEGCHGPGSAHQASPGSVTPPFTGDVLKLDRCAECHQRGGFSNAIPASSGYIKHHEQSNEMSASKHLDGSGMDLTCISCHDAHVPLKYPEQAESGTVAITTTCQTCHTGKEITFPDGTPKSIDCVDCHMSRASKSALGHQLGNGWKGDVRTHIFAINTAPVEKDSTGLGMFTDDGSAVRLDGSGLAAVTLDFACLSCHTDKDIAWASEYADNMHGKFLAMGEGNSNLPVSFNLMQNYPNPFNPSTSIEFHLPKAAQVKLSIYTIDGRLVGHILQSKMPAGEHKIKFEAGHLASGIYFYKIDAGSFVQTKKMVLMK